MRLPIYVVDAFTNIPFHGNPAAVVLLDRPVDDGWMQSVAAEMRHSETAFVAASPSDADGTRSLRWFTPAAEVDLCGHATLAAAHVLGGSQRFATRSGELTSAVGLDGWISVDFPLDRATLTPGGDDRLAVALRGVSIVAVGRGTSDFLVEVASAAEVEAVVPDLDALAGLDARGVIVTARAESPGTDFVSRCFYPAVGVPEDPVTGSAHCTLAAWWMTKLCRPELVASQLSARGGTVRMLVAGDRVALSGQAVTVLAGDLAAGPIERVRTPMRS